MSEHLDAVNSTILFGCRQGICGTCLCELTSHSEGIRAPTIDEQEALDLYAPENPKARLACQITLEADIELKKIDWHE